MVENTERRPAWADSALYERGVAHYEAEEWEMAILAFSQLATEFPRDVELQRILSELRLKASLRSGEAGRGRLWMRVRSLGRAALPVLAAVALVVVLAGVSRFVYVNWLLPAREVREQTTHLRDLHELAVGYMNAGEYDRAAEIYREILSEFPDDAAAAEGLKIAEQREQLRIAYDAALQLTQEEGCDEALEAWRAIHARDPNFLDVDRRIAYCERQQPLDALFTEAEMRYLIEDWSGAVAALEQLRGQNANYRAPWVASLLVSSYVNLAGQILGEASDPAEVHSQVMALFDSAIQVRPQDESVLTARQIAEAFSQSCAIFRAEECEGALQEIQSVYSDEPLGSAAQRLGVLYHANVRCGDERLGAGDFPGAQTCYEAAIDLPVDDVSEATDKLAALGPKLTPTATRRPPTPAPIRRPAAPTPTHTATVSPWLYAQLGATAHRHNDKNAQGCDWLGVGGQVFDAVGGGQSGVSVRVWSGGWEDIRRSGEKGEYGPGGWEVYLYPHPKDGVWNAQIVDAGGAGLSPVVTFQTYGGDCSRNLVLISFRRTS